MTNATKKTKPKKPSTTPRLVFFVRYIGGRRGWALIADGDVTLSNKVKTDLVYDSTMMLGRAWLTMRVKSELHICDKKGVIRDARTFGEDPPGIRG